MYTAIGTVKLTTPKCSCHISPPH